MKVVPVFLVLLLISCSNHMGSVTKSSLKNIFDLQGHRGCRGLMPENTISAMRKAVDLGVTTLEMDVVITKDNQVILSHEPFFNHEITTRPDGTSVSEADETKLNIYKMTYAEAATYDVGLKPHPRFPKQHKMKVSKPKLSAVIDSIEAYCEANNLLLPYYNIETKIKPSTDGIYHPGPQEFVDLLMNVIHFKMLDKRVIIQSFDPRTLQYLHEKHSSIRTALLIEDFDVRPLSEQLKELGFTPSIYSPASNLVTPTLVKQCKDLGVKLIPWTVNDPAQMKMLKEMGVDGLITDYPNIKF
jgi:glycerophosphoryl diester phosphodiesterase